VNATLLQRLRGAGGSARFVDGPGRGAPGRPAAKARIENIADPAHAKEKAHPLYGISAAGPRALSFAARLT
jgi:hypothetical protein